jgi:hypothetical protein
MKLRVSGMALLLRCAVFPARFLHDVLQHEVVSGHFHGFFPANDHKSTAGML